MAKYSKKAADKWISLIVVERWKEFKTGNQISEIRDQLYSISGCILTG